MSLSHIGKVKFYWATYRLIFVALVLFTCALFLHSLTQKPKVFISKQESAVNFKIDFIKFFSLGNKRLISDLIWVQTLMESDQEHYKQKDLNSWMYLRFASISELDPNFYQNYLYGGQFLSIIKDDLPGAAVIFEKGLSRYPNDYDLNYYAALMYYYEMGDAQKGILHFEKIINDPRAPSFFSSIVNKLKLETGEDLDTIYQLVSYNYENTEDPTLKAKLEQDLYAIKAEIDLKCLNHQGVNCGTRDQFGSPYVLKNGTYYSEKPFSLYRIRKRGDLSPLSEKIIRTVR
ncbi:tetratricopeptide repeat protein [Peredibacter starrii]|uniref:Tetratricopeptide repeat protein n=1 Tax=Peredibacter starrii TaxID=28202 RepID=A0AAX4HQU3_9BACT|nr:hypothetical protein [Peredibacter starrii]WPU65532.1 hypothetical protein SOO65_02105 [Peredibacter starrii]